MGIIQASKPSADDHTVSRMWMIHFCSPFTSDCHEVQRFTIPYMEVMVDMNHNYNAVRGVVTLSQTNVALTSMVMDISTYGKRG